MRLFADVSCHGFGHMMQTSCVFAALAARDPALDIVLRTDLAGPDVARFWTGPLSRVPGPLDPALAMAAPDRIDTSKFDIEPRMHQILAPLLSVADDETDKTSILAHASAAQDALTDARGQTVEAEVLTVIKKLMTTEGSAGVAMQEIAAMHGKAYLDGTSRPLAARAMGHIIRTKLNLKSRKSHGVFVVPKTQHNELDRLYARYGVSDEDVAHLSDLLGETLRVEFGDVGGHLRAPERRDAASH